MPTLRDLRGNPIDDDAVDVRDVRAVDTRHVLVPDYPEPPRILPDRASVNVWHPWEQFRVDVPRLAEERLPIAGPPCAGCAHWKPRREFSTIGMFIGVRLCWTDSDMHADFSCFVPKDGSA